MIGLKTDIIRILIVFFFLISLPGGSVVKNLPDNVEDTSLIPDPGGSHMLCG